MRVVLGLGTLAAFSSCGDDDTTSDGDDTDTAPGDSDTDNDTDVGPDCATPVGQLPYLEAADSPWADAGLATFTIEDIEDLALPDGVTATPLNWTSYVFGASGVDSVDGDDGDPTNNACPLCQSMWTDNAIAFVFDPTVLGGVPTHTGVVLTDLAGTTATVTLGGTSPCGALEPFSTEFVDDGLYHGETYEDRFVGFEVPDGITTLTLSIGIPAEVDHLQYGW
jgi:hypothetical protein